MEQLARFAQWLGAGEARGAAAVQQVVVPQGETEEEREEEIDRLLQRFSVLLEYEKLQDLLPPGMYVLPSFSSPLAWHGTLFARQGLYRGGVFKFTLELPSDYPESRPELRFVTDIFHPLVDPNDGRVDLAALFPEWRAGRDYASLVLPHLYRALVRREYFAGSSRPPFNPEAREMFLNNPAAFAERAAACASSSLEKVHETAPGFSLQFTKGPAEAHDLILEQIRTIDPSGSLEDRKKAFVDWLCNHYANERTHVGVESPEVETIMVDPIILPDGESEPASLHDGQDEEEEEDAEQEEVAF